MPFASPRTPKDSEPARSLCPVCDSPVLTIAGSVSVRYDVRVAGPEADLVVAGEAIAEDGWEPGNEASCPACGWRGTVADVDPLRGRID